MGLKRGEHYSYTYSDADGANADASMARESNVQSGAKRVSEIPTRAYASYVISTQQDGRTPECVRWGSCVCASLHKRKRRERKLRTHTATESFLCLGHPRSRLHGNRHPQKSRARIFILE